MVDALLCIINAAMIGAIYSRTGHKVLQDVFHIHLTAAIFLNSTLDIMVRKTLRKASVLVFSPSIALGWLVSEEQFMEPIRNVISKLKLRASVGTVGNDNIGGRRFAYITTINSKANGYNWGYTGDTYRTVCRKEKSV